MSTKFERLMTVGGFPEPFLQGDERSARRRRRERLDRVIREEVRDLEDIRNVQVIGMFLDALRSRVGGLVILSNIAEDLQVSPKTAKSWLGVLERMYLVFPVYPYTRNIPRAVLKPPKVYFFDKVDFCRDPGGKARTPDRSHVCGKPPSRSLRYYAERLHPEQAVQIHPHLPRPYEVSGVFVGR